MTLDQFLSLEADDILRIPYVHSFGKDKKIEVKPLTIGLYAKINPYLTTISKENVKAIRESAEKNNFEEMPELFDKYITPILSIIKAITNATDKDIEDMEFRDIYIILLSILSRMGTKSFQMSIITGNVLSRNQEPEIIAASHSLAQSI